MNLIFTVFLCFLLHSKTLLSVQVNSTSIRCHEECDPPDRCRDSSPATCFDCKNRRLATTGDCVNKCPRGFYPLQETIGYSVYRLCGPCSPECEFCSGPRRFECQKCAKGFYMDTMNFFGGLWMRLCRPCHESCATCFGIGAFTNRFFCYTCPEGYFRSTSYSRMRRNHVLVCEPCHSSCQTCSGGSQYACLSCPSGHALHSRRSETRYRQVISRCVKCTDSHDSNDSNDKDGIGCKALT